MVNTIVSSMARSEEIEGLKAAYAFQLALVANSGLTEESFKNSQKTAKEIFAEMIDVLAPWAAKDAGKRKDREINSLIDAYKRLVGDPDDPEFQDKLLHDLAVDDKPPPVETEPEEARIERLIYERDAYYAKKGSKPRK